LPRQIGLKNIYTAKVLTDPVDGTTTYEAPRKLERSIKANIKPKVSTAKLYSEDSMEDVMTLFDSADVSIELNQLSLSSRAYLQGSKVIKGQLVENKDDIPPTLAFGFQSRKTNGKYRYIWLYKGSFSLGDDTYETQADKIKDQTASLSATFYARDSDGNWRTIADNDEVNADLAKIASWFSEVATPPVGAIITTLSVVAGMASVVTGIVGTVVTVAAAQTVAQLKSALEVDGGNGTLEVYSTSGMTTYALDVATVVGAMVIKAIAEDGTTVATYTIAVV